MNLPDDESSRSREQIAAQLSFERQLLAFHFDIVHDLIDGIAEREYQLGRIDGPERRPR